MPKVKSCRRGHLMVKANVLEQLAAKRLDGTRAVAKVCKACCKLRRDKRAAGKPVRDMRRAS